MNESVEDDVARRIFADDGLLLERVQLAAVHALERHQPPRS
jgi:hypothetical protein